MYVYPTELGKLLYESDIYTYRLCTYYSLVFAKTNLLQLHTYVLLKIKGNLIILRKLLSI